MQTIIRTDPQRHAFVERLYEIPLPVSIKCEPHVEGDQAHERGWYWWDLGIIAEQVVVNGRKYSDEIWHEHYKRKFLPIVAEGEIDGVTHFIHKSTEKLSIRERRKYRYQVESDAVQELGVMFPDYHQEAG